MTHSVTAQLQVEKIESNSGYTIIQKQQILIPKTYNYPLHIIDLNQINKIVQELADRSVVFPENVYQPLIKNIHKLQGKLLTLEN